MRRPVFYDPAVTAAKTAAALVDDEFEVGPCIPGTLPAGVVLTGDHGLAAADPSLRAEAAVMASSKKNQTCAPFPDTRPHA
jgi:hypothetical protein